MAPPLQGTQRCQHMAGDAAVLSAVRSIALKASFPAFQNGGGGSKRQVA